MYISTRFNDEVDFDQKHVTRINSKIYKHYSIIKPQGCGLSPKIEKRAIEKALKRNFLNKAAPDSYDIPYNINLTYKTNRAWLHNHQRTLNDSKDMQMSLAEIELKNFQKNKQGNTNRLIEFLNSQIKSKSKPPPEIDPPQSKSVQSSPRRRRRVILNSLEQMQIEQQIVLPTMLTEVIPSPKTISPKYVPQMQVIKDSENPNRSLENTVRIMEDCTSVVKQMRDHYDEIDDINIRFQSKTLKLMRRLSPSREDKEPPNKLFSIGKLRELDKIHEYYVQQRNEELILKQGTQIDESQLYESRLLVPSKYNKLILDQRKKQYRQQSQNVKIHRMVEEKKFGKVLKIGDFVGF